MRENRPRILVCRIGAVGDICMTLPIVKALSNQYEVHWLIRTGYIPLTQCFPEVKFLPVGVNPTKRVWFSEDLFPFLRNQNYEALLDFSHWPEVSYLVNQLQDIPLRATFYDPKQDELLQIKLPTEKLYGPFNQIVPVDSNLHLIEKMTSLVRRTLDIELRLDWPLRDISLPKENSTLFIHPHSDNLKKQWPIDHFVWILKQWNLKRKLTCLINGGRVHEEAEAKKLADKLVKQGIEAKILPLDPSFKSLKETIMEVDMAIGTDSGPMHFASLLGTPTFVIFGSYPATCFRPLWRAQSVSPNKGRPARELSKESVWKTLAPVIS